MSEQNNPFLEQEIDLREYLRVLYDRRWMIASITVIFCTLALIRSFLMTPVYEASTKILIQKTNPRVLNSDIKEVDADAYGDAEYYASQHKILKSFSLAERVNTALGGYRPWGAWRGREQDNDKPKSDESRANALLGRIKVTPVPNTRLVSISAEDSDPARAAKISSLWAENYITYLLDMKYSTAQDASGWLQTKIEEARGKLEKSEGALQNYRKENEIVVVDTENKQKSMLDQLLEKKSMLGIELSEQLEYLKEKHPEIIGLRSEIASVERSIEAERAKELTTRDKEIRYSMLKREVDINKEMYRSLLERVSETEITEGLKATNVKIIDKAATPKSPVRPKKLKDLSVAFFLGLLISGGLAFLFEGLDQSVKNPDDIKNHIKLPALASIAVPDEKELDVKPEFITFLKPRSVISEAYRSLRTSIMFTSVKHKRKTLLVTSSGPQEGKTTTAINLAIVMALAGEKTILIDADLRQPRVEKAFNIKLEKGLSEVLIGTGSIESATYTTDIPNLDVITCGTIPPNPSELLGSGKMDEFLQKMQAKYDRIIIDTPPVLAVTDAVVLSGKVDGSILVVRSCQTNRNAVLKTKEIMESASKETLIGVVLNMVENARTGGYYYYHNYYGKYGKYGEKKEAKKKTFQEIPA